MYSSSGNIYTLAEITISRVRLRWIAVAQMEAVAQLPIMCRRSAKGASFRAGPCAGSMKMRLEERRGNEHEGCRLQSLRIGKQNWVGA